MRRFSRGARPWLLALLLVPGCGNGGPDGGEQKPVEAASRIDLVKVLMEDEAFDVEGALLLAARDGDAATVRHLLGQGVDGRRADDHGLTPLHWTALMGRVAAARVLIEAAGEGSRKAVVRARDERGWTPLHHASFRGHREVAALLLEHGAPGDAVADDGSRPLHLAVLGRQTATAELLAEKGAHVNALDGEGRTPRDLADALGVETLVRTLEEAAAREMERPVARALRDATEAYLDALGRGDVAALRAVSTPEHAEDLGDELEAVSLEHGFVDVEWHGDEARVVTRLTSAMRKSPVFLVLEYSMRDGRWLVTRTTASLSWPPAAGD